MEIALQRFTHKSCLIAAIILIASLILPIFHHDAHALSNDGADYHFESPYYGVMETDEAITLKVLRTTGTESAGTVQYVLGFPGTLGNALPGVDFDGQAAQGTLIFDPGETSKTITIPIYDDVLPENTQSKPGTPTRQAELLTVDLYVQSIPYAISSTTICIWDDDWGQSESPGSLIFLYEFDSVSEAAGTYSLFVSRMNGAHGQVTVNYTTSSTATNSDSPYQAAENVDYMPVSGTLTFADGEWWKKIEIPITDNDAKEDVRLFRVQLSNPSGGATLGNWSNISIEITEKGGRPTTALANWFEFDVFSDHANEGKDNMIHVIRKNPTDDEILVDYETFDGTAQSGSDYEHTSGTLIFAPGETEKWITIPVTNDRTVEDMDENFGIRLSNPTGGEAIIPGAEKYIEIIDIFNRISFANHTNNVIEEEGMANLRLLRSGNTNGRQTIHYYTVPGSATSDDFTPVSGNITFESQEWSKTIQIPILDDNLIEYKEQFQVLTSNGSGTDVVIFDEDHLK